MFQGIIGIPWCPGENEKDRNEPEGPVDEATLSAGKEMTKVARIRVVALALERHRMYHKNEKGLAKIREFGEINNSSWVFQNVQIYY